MASVFYEQLSRQILKLRFNKSFGITPPCGSFPYSVFGYVLSFKHPLNITLAR